MASVANAAGYETWLVVVSSEWQCVAQTIIPHTSAKSFGPMSIHKLLAFNVSYEGSSQCDSVGNLDTFVFSAALRYSKRMDQSLKVFTESSPSPSPSLSCVPKRRRMDTLSPEVM